MLYYILVKERNRQNLKYQNQFSDIDRIFRFPVLKKHPQFDGEFRYFSEQNKKNELLS